MIFGTEPSLRWLVYDSSTNPPLFLINDDWIEPPNNIEYLGIKIDQYLSWKDQIGERLSLRCQEEWEYFSILRNVFHCILSNGCTVAS